MNTMADETLAFSVAEATMQEWLAAMLLVKLEPMPPRPQPQQPVYVRPAFVRPAPRIVPARPAPRPVRPVAEHSGRFAGARTVYWLGLAAALAATLLF
jgi:hypothetical protein